jgi:hypothetical protein
MWLTCLSQSAYSGSQTDMRTRQTRKVLATSAYASRACRILTGRALAGEIIEFGWVNQSQSAAFPHHLRDVSLVVYRIGSLAGFSLRSWTRLG